MNAAECGIFICPNETLIWYTNYMKKYWFLPKRFGVFAGYHPVTWQGWVITILFLGLFMGIFFVVDSRSHSGSDTLINFALPGVVVLLVFDIITLRTGEYPSWWKRRWGSEKDKTPNH